MQTITTQQPTQRANQLKGALLLSLALILVFIGFALDGITEYGHHAMFIISGICIGIGIGKLKH